MAQARATYDLQGALTALLPGIVVQRNLLDAANAIYAAGNFAPLTEAQALAAMAAANAIPVPEMATPADGANDPTTEADYPATLPQPLSLTGDESFAGVVDNLEPEIIGRLPRFLDSNPSPKMGLNRNVSGNPRVVGG